MAEWVPVETGNGTENLELGAISFCVSNYQTLGRDCNPETPWVGVAIVEPDGLGSESGPIVKVLNAESCDDAKEAILLQTAAWCRDYTRRIDDILLEMYKKRYSGEK